MEKHDPHFLPEKPGDRQITYSVCADVERVPDVLRLSKRGLGDCYLCSSYAIIQHFCRKLGVVPPAISTLYHQGWAHEDIGADSGSTSMTTDLFWARWADCLDWKGPELECEVDPPWDFDYPLQRMSTFGPTPYTERGLGRRVRTYLEAGYLIHASNHIGKASDERAKGVEPESNHMVVIDGYRRGVHYRQLCNGLGGVTSAGRHFEEIHVVCSNSRNPEPFWIDISEWIREHGGFNMWMIRPKRDSESSFPAKSACTSVRERP